MKFLGLFMLVYATSAEVMTSSDCSTALFDAWRQRHGHTFTTDSVQRQQIFCNRTRQIAEHNRRYLAGESSYFMKLHKYSANTDHEWATMFGTRIANPQTTGTDGCTPPDTLLARAPEVSSVDWRKSGKVTGVKDQGTCGSW